MDYNAEIELDVRFPTDDEQAEHLVDQLMDDFAPYHVAVGRTPHGRVSLILTLPADSMRQATSTLLAVLAANGWTEPFALQVMPTDEFDRRSEEEMVPAMLSVTGAAEVLEVSRPRVQQLIDDGKLAAVKVGATWAVLRSSAETRAAAMGRVAGVRAAAQNRVDAARQSVRDRVAADLGGAELRACCDHEHHDDVCTVPGCDCDGWSPTRAV